MNTNLFERKAFLDGNWMKTNTIDQFSSIIDQNNLIIKVHLLRATANEAEAFRKFLFNHKVKKLDSVVIDLRNCSFVDSTFLSTLISFNKITTAEIKLVVSDKKQLAIFRITKLDSLFNIFQSIEAAVV